MADTAALPVDDEPKSPMWLPALGAALFVAVALWWAVTPPAPIAPEPQAAASAPAAAPPPPTATATATHVAAPPSAATPATSQLAMPRPVPGAPSALPRAPTGHGPAGVRPVHPAHP